MALSPMLSSASVAGCLILNSNGASSAWETGQFSWRCSEPLITVGPGRDAPDPHVSVKDPTLVNVEGRWHLFATLRMKSGKVDILYMNFTDWAEADKAPRHILGLHNQYYCAPQVFFFTPHNRWYLVYQLADTNRTPAFGPCFSTTTNLSNPRSWSPPQPMITQITEKPKWLDFWVICDSQNAHLFYTSLDGRMWRRQTAKTAFPFGWSEPQLALRGDIFEASHTYRLKNRYSFLTIIEAQRPGGRYYKAYLADRLEGPWKPLADSLARPFAARENIRPAPGWTASVSHGELARAGINEELEVDPNHLRFVFQGASETEYRGNPYARIPWRLGMLEMEP